MAEENGMRITIAHISTDYRALNYVPTACATIGSAGGDPAKALLNELACTVSCRWIPLAGDHPPV